MSFRFWRRVTIVPGVTLNLSKSGGSLSFGPRGAKFTVGPRGRRATVGLPGTGLFYTKTQGKGKSRRRRGASSSQPVASTIPPEDRLTLGFFQRLVTPADEKALVNGCRELVLGHEDQALTHLRDALHLADGAYLAGFLALKHKQLEAATRDLTTAAEKHDRLGHYFAKYEISAVMTLPITDEVSAHVRPNLRGVLLGLVEVCQRQQQWPPARAHLERLGQPDPHDVGGTL